MFFTSIFFLNVTTPTDIYTLSLHDALPICLIFKLAPSVCRMTFPILASLLVRLVVLLPFQLLRLSLATNLTSKEDRKSGSAGMPRPKSYAASCWKKKTNTSLDGDGI